ncbi:MAG: recombinase family protein [Opitutaceae bacterium]
MSKHTTIADQKVRQILKIVRVIIYARVSSQKQLDNKEEDSIKSQIHCCRKFCKEMQRVGEQWEIVEVISDDGRTGRNDKRDGINRVRERTTRGDADVVLVYGLSRAFRNSRLGHDFDQTLQENGVRLVSTTQPGGNDTPYEKFVRSIFWALAELTSNIIADDVRRSILTRLEKGLTHGGVPKPGYGIQKGRLYIVPEDAKVVLQTFEMTLQGMTPMEIVNDLNKRKIRTRKRTSNKGIVTGGKRFRIEHVLTILRDPIYKGVLIHDGEVYPSAAESIVSKEIWEKAQVALDQRSGKKEDLIQDRDKNFMPLKGKVRCGCCNSAMKPSFSTKRMPDGSMKKYFYYLCSKHEKMGNESVCDIRRIPARLLESLLMEAFGEIAANPQIAKRLVQKAPKAKTTKIRKLAKERQQIRRKLKDLDAEVERVTEKVLQISGTAVGEKLQEKIEALTIEKNDLVTKEVRLNREIDMLKSDVLTTEQFQNALSHFADAVKCLPEDEQREFYKLLFKSIIVRVGGKAKDPVNGNTRHHRHDRRQLSVEVRLRTEAIHTLFGEEHPNADRKSGFTIPLEIAHCRKKPAENCAILSPIHKECGHKTPKTRKRPKKTEHEIHRAIRWKNEMGKLGIGQNELARKKGLSYPAMAQAMRWIKLSPEAQSLLKSITDGALIRKLGRRSIFPLIELPEADQVQKIKEMIRSAC